MRTVEPGRFVGFQVLISPKNFRLKVSPECSESFVKQSGSGVRDSGIHERRLSRADVIENLNTCRRTPLCGCDQFRRMQE